jgi:hypothetical protein
MTARDAPWSTWSNMKGHTLLNKYKLGYLYKWDETHVDRWTTGPRNHPH